MARLITFALLISVALVVGGRQAQATPPALNGVLRPSSNPHYFANNSGPVYLAGAYGNTRRLVWDLNDSFSSYTSLLNFVQTHNLNFVRLWRWEHIYTVYGSYLGPPTPLQPWARSSTPGAYDGGNKFDLGAFDQAYFDDLVTAVDLAKQRNIYVMVMLFEGHCAQFCTDNTNRDGHPFASSNNINGLNADPNNDGQIDEYYTATPGSTIYSYQTAYVDKVLDTLQSYDNVLYEVSNETINTSATWQYNIGSHIQSYESSRGYGPHPVIMSSIIPADSNSALYSSSNPAVAVSPQWNTDPPVADAAKISIWDTDHNQDGGFKLIGVDRAWKIFTRGFNILGFDETNLCCESGDFINSTPTEGDLALQDILSYASRIDLVNLYPSATDCSTGYCLVRSGVEYLLYQPNGGSFTVNLPAGTYSYEWFNPGTHAVDSTGTTTSSGGSPTFTPPFGGVAVLYLKIASASSFSVSASPSSVAPGGSISVSWTAPAGQTSSTDWIGLYKVGDPNASYGWWSYTNGATSGSFTVTAPSTAGTYEFRYLLNDSYTDVARSNSVTVTLAGGPTVENPGFETGSLSPWVNNSASSVVSGQARTGTYAAQITAYGGYFSQQITGLTPNQTYTVHGFAKVSGEGSVRVGVHQYNGSQQSDSPQITATSYTEGTAQFTPSGTTATIYCWRDAGSATTAYCDDFSITVG